MTGSFDLGGRGTTFTGDSGRYNESRDLSNGLFLDTFGTSIKKSGWLVDLGGTHAGRQDAFYSGEAVRPGSLKIWGSFDRWPRLLTKVAAGQKLYDTEKCGTCHQIKGVGGKLSTALDGVSRKFSEADIRKWLTTPAAMEAKLPKKPAMPMSTYLKSHKLADADIDALTAYMLSLK